MKKITLTIGLFVSFFGAIHAQLTPPGEVAFDYTKELQRVSSIPNSPEAAAFEKYGNTPVSLYTGTANVNIPIYTHQGREMSLPISLNYDTSGIKVDQMATQVGLGWNLNVGGRISRTVNGLPDDYVEVSGAYETMYSAGVRDKVQMINDLGSNRTFDTKQELEDYFRFLEDISDNQIDSQVDFYSLTVPGVSDMITLDVNNNMNPVAVNNPRIRVQKTHGANNSLNSWTVTGEDGTKYFFTVTEQTQTRQDAVSNGYNIINKHNSSWLLTKIESPNKKDVYEFSYVSYGFWGQEPVGYSATVAINTIDPYQTVYNNPDKVSGLSMPYTIKQQFLTTIKHNNKVIVSNSLGSRLDTDGRSRKLDYITITDPLGNQVEKVNFTYTYFGNTASSNIFDKRLKLDKVSFSGKQASSNEKEYSFEYDRWYDVPSRLSLARDKWGYYNGVNNTVLYPSYSDGTYTFAGANRETDTYQTKVGILNRITYPTKGYSVFTYEGHQAYKQVEANQDITRLSAVINPNDPVDTNLFLREDGSICDDEFIETGYPQIKLVQFIVPTSPTGNGHTIEGTNILRASIARIGDITQVTNISENLQIFNYTGTDNHQSYCDFNNTLWNSTSTNFSQNIVLAPGVYKAMILSSPNDNLTSSLWIHKQVLSLVGQNVPVGGLRIQKIEDYAAPNTQPITREFNYNDPLGKSTAELQFEPLFWQIKKVLTFGADDSYGGEKYQLERNAFSSKSTGGSHIVYKTVKEYQLDANGNKNGFTTYTFHQKKEGVVGRSSYPFQQDFWGGTIAGSTEKTETFDRNNTKLTEQATTQYYQPEVFQNKGLMVYSEADKAQYWIIAFKNANNKWQYYLSIPGPCTTGGSDVPPGTAHASHCLEFQTNPTAYRLNFGKSASLRPASQFIFGQVTAPEITVSTETFEGQDVVTTTTNTFDPAVDHLISQTKTEVKGEEHLTQYYYPKNLTGSIHTAMVTANRLAVPVKIEQYKDNQKIAAKNTVYRNYGNDRIQAERIQTAKGDNLVTTGPFVQEVFEDRMVIHSYDTNGNPQEISQKDGSHTLLIWGYNNMYPLARIDNATYEGMPATVTNLINQIRTASNTENSSAQETTLRGLLNNLRNQAFFKDGQMTSYTYDPQVGVTSITDPRGYTTYYSYDNFNRLLQVKDQDGNIVSENEYNFK